jgi:ABC-2 type transport system permease protein
MTTLDATAPPAGEAAAEPLTHASGWSAFKALLSRDAYVLAHNLKEFLPRTLIQPFLLVFVFTYVLPKIGLGIGGSSGPPAAALKLLTPAQAALATKAAAAQASAYSASLIAGVIGSVILFQGIQAVALPLVQEFGYTREIEDRVLAPLPVELVAGEKIVAGALQCLIAGLLVFPIAAIVPATPIHLHITWWVLLTILPLACLMASTLGLTFGTIFDPRTVPMLFGVIVIPITFLGCIYYPWSRLSAIPWLKVVSLANPLVYISEGFRAALTNAPHMSLIAIYPVMVAFIGFLTWRGIAGFKKRVIA